MSAIANFTTSLSSSKPYQILLSGLTAGTYTLKLGSTTIYSGTVAAGDNSIYAEVSSGTTDGTISLNNSAPHLLHHHLQPAGWNGWRAVFPDPWHGQLHRAGYLERCNRGHYPAA